MKILRGASEAEVVAEFLKAEITSSRFGQFEKETIAGLGLSEDLVTKPNLQDEKENDARDKVLGLVRGWEENKYLFENFPDDVKWELVEFSEDELSKFRRMNFGDGVRTVAEEAMQNSEFHVEEIVAGLQNGLVPANLILVMASGGTVPTVIEGHARATAYIQSGILANPYAYLGTSPKMSEWRGYAGQVGFGGAVGQGYLPGLTKSGFMV